ncbi:unnamed protein product, partial [Didymodactylos carnosus]
TITGLEPNINYMLLLDIVPVGDNQYIYEDSKWHIAGKAMPHSFKRYYVHSNGVQMGLQWMKDCVQFNKVKITNHSREHIILNSMHPYQISLHIVETSDIGSITSAKYNTFTFDETVFMAVTSYKNPDVTHAKICYNPFAMALRGI